MTLQDAICIMVDHYNDRSYWWDLRRNPAWVEASQIVRAHADEIVKREWEVAALPPFDYPKENRE